MSLSTSATRHLDSLGMAYRLHVHSRPVRSLEQAAQERGLEPDQIVRSLLFRLENDAFVLVLMPGARQVAWPKLRLHLGVSRITTATREQVLAETGYPPGAVSPFGIPHPLRILADQGILAHAVLSLGAGVPNAGLILAGQDLLTALHPELLDLAEDSVPTP